MEGGAKVENFAKTWTWGEKLGWQAGRNEGNTVPEHPIRVYLVTGYR
jgi:hypothetical protein